MQEGTKTILGELKHMNLSANEIISSRANGYAYEMVQNIIKLQHLNKLPSYMEKQGLIVCVGNDDCGDKILSITKEGLAYLDEPDDE